LNTTRALVVDDNDRFRWRLGQFLATMPHIRVVGEAATGQEALLSARELKPDLVLMDVRLPEMSGVSATRHLCEALPQARVIVLSVYDLQEYRDAALARGASAYLIKKSMIAELIPTTQRVLQLTQTACAELWGQEVTKPAKDRTGAQGEAGFPPVSWPRSSPLLSPCVER